MNLIREFGGLQRLRTFKNYFEGKRILLVTGRESFHKSGASTTLSCSLSHESTITFSDFSVNPKLDDAIKGANIARKNKIEVIIAVGGGSVLDIAKLIKAFYLHPDDEKKVAVGSEPVRDPLIPLIAVPTTSGSGSEETHFAVIYVDGEKYSLAAEFLKPNAVVLDGSLSKSGTQYQKACNALDAMAQAIESYWAVGSTAESREYSIAALELGWHTLPSYVSDKCTNSEVEKMLEAANLAGKAINISKTTAAHAWSYAFTAEYDIPHGHAVWLTLPQIFEVHAKHASYANSNLQRIISELMEILGIGASESVSDTLKSYLDLINIEHRFENLNMDKMKRIELAGKVNMERMSNNPVKFSDEEILRIFS